MHSWINTLKTVKIRKIKIVINTSMIVKRSQKSIQLKKYNYSDSMQSTMYTVLEVIGTIIMIKCIKESIYSK